MTESTRRGIAAGVGLIVLGGGLYFLQQAGGLGRGIYTVLAGGAMVAGYLYWKSAVLLVPGCLLLALGLGSIGQRSFFALDRVNWVPIGLGFVAVTLITFAYERRVRLWPLIPGILLILLGFEKAWREFTDVLRSGWPIVLVGFGVLIVVISLLRGRTGRSSIS